MKLSESPTKDEDWAENERFREALLQIASYPTADADRMRMIAHDALRADSYTREDHER